MNGHVTQTQRSEGLSIGGRFTRSFLPAAALMGIGGTGLTRLLHAAGLALTHDTIINAYVFIAAMVVMLFGRVWRKSGHKFVRLMPFAMTMMALLPVVLRFVGPHLDALAVDIVCIALFALMTAFSLEAVPPLPARRA